MTRAWARAIDAASTNNFSGAHGFAEEVEFTLPASYGNEGDFFGDDDDDAGSGP